MLKQHFWSVVSGLPYNPADTNISSSTIPHSGTCLILSKSRSRESCFPRRFQRQPSIVFANIVVSDYVRRELQNIECSTSFPDGTIVASVALQFFDAAASLLCITQTKSLRLKSVDGNYIV